MGALSIAIAGAGPAGLSAALLLHRDGHRVTLFEQFEAPKPLGSGLILQPTGLAVLEELGLSERILSLGSRLDRLFGRVLPSGRVVLDVRYRVLGGDRHGLGVHRAALFNVLFDAVVAAGIPIETSRRISGIERAADDRPILVGERGRRAGPFDLVDRRARRALAALAALRRQGAPRPSLRRALGECALAGERLRPACARAALSEARAR